MEFGIETNEINFYYIFKKIKHLGKITDKWGDGSFDFMVKKEKLKNELISICECHNIKIEEL